MGRGKGLRTSLDDMLKKISGSSARTGTHFVLNLRHMTKYVNVVLRLLLPVCLYIYYTWLRNQRTVVNGLRKQLGPAVLAVISLSSLSGSVLLPSSKFDPILRTFRVIKFRPRRLLQQSDHPQQTATVDTSEPEKCVTCDVLYDPSPQPIRADVIFIHGLHGSLDKTWKQGVWDVTKRAFYRLLGDDEQEDNSENEPYSKCWPRDWLPKDCPGVRVIALNYTTDPYLWRPLWVAKRNRTCMLERSREMMDHLKKLGVGKNPIIWVGHSKGGLFVKQMIVDAFESGDDILSGFYGNTRGIMFYSVPHRGSPCADINLPLLRQSVELTEVQKDCPEVLELHAKFLSLINNKQLEVEIFSFIETVQTFMTFLYIQIVSIESAAIRSFERMCDYSIVLIMVEENQLMLIKPDT
ncbi:hypothetical protein Cfor_01735 [Coptotermes formosanus]|uniref:DUF676 domain-containing protein n=1 Tax=Coptotermes formosanus TaxID=36987 RepID=A0A6L2Q1G4_COPFO|nr:hypothetical protein Cfor_01735 [Coptotermes formosanus]